MFFLDNKRDFDYIIKKKSLLFKLSSDIVISIVLIEELELLIRK